MTKHYLHTALRKAAIAPRQFYTLEEIAVLAEATDMVPTSTTPEALRHNLRIFARRNIPERYSIHDGGPVRYPGAAWLYCVPDTWPSSLGDLEREWQMSRKGDSPMIHPQPSQRTRKPPWRSLALVPLACLGLFAGGWGTTTFLQYIRSTPQDIIADADQKDTLSFSERYHLAEAHFDAGDFEAAEKIAYDLLKSRSIPTYIEGHSNFLLAKINSQRGQNETALGQAGLARTAYLNTPEDHTINLRGVDTLRAVILIRQEQYELALDQLQSLFEHEQSESYRAYVALKASDVCFWLALYPEALEWGKIASEGYRHAGDRGGQAIALNNLAWMQILAGNTDLAAQNLDKARTLMEITGKHILKPYIGLTEAFLGRCTGKPLPLESYRESTDPMLVRYVDFIEGYACNPAHIVSDNPPPQGDPPPKGSHTGRPAPISPDAPPPQQDPPPGAGPGRIVAETPPPQTDPPPKKSGAGGPAPISADTPPPQQDPPPR